MLDCNKSHKRPVIISGPCSLESKQLALDVAGYLAEAVKGLDVDFYFKGSFDKANRTSISSFRGPGLDRGLEILQTVQDKTGLRLTTDIHETHQAEAIGEVVDIVQVPAFLCRQTDLLVAAGQTGKLVNIKKGQFMAPAAMRFAVEKVKSVTGQNVYLTERGTFFGYGDLVVDFRSMRIMSEFAPVIFDAGHSVQQPAAETASTGGRRVFIRDLALAAATQNVDGLFFETHPKPDMAKSDGANMLSLKEAGKLIRDFLSIWKTVLAHETE